MAQVIADHRDIEFVLYEQLETETLIESECFSQFTRKMFDMIINEARSFAIEEILPTYTQGDREGVSYLNSTVKAPECFRRPFELYTKDSWGPLTQNPAFGGHGLPYSVASAVEEYLNGANYSFTSYPLMGLGVGEMIELFGTEKEKKLFVENIYLSKWGGTMCLTEPQAGSDVGAIITSASKNQDGTYSITGNKIFATAGDHDMVENIIHAVLARVEGAPQGAKGISLFIVPKIWVNDDSSLGEMNDVVCTGVEEKMGIHGLATCSLTFGGKGKCRGLLLGEENKGLNVMFHMMNKSRLEVGSQGLWHASPGYLHALSYAKERIQGKDLSDRKNPEAPSIPIIQHPDVRRMLLHMKAYVAGMRSFIYYVANCMDKIKSGTSVEEREKYDDMVSLLTPILKAYCSESGLKVCLEAINVFGGYGYTKDYPVEQLVRDCKIATIYEGTNGIQAMDFLGRKLGMKKGKTFHEFIQNIRKTIDEAKKLKLLRSLVVIVEKSLDRLEATALRIGALSTSSAYRVAYAFSFPFLELVGDVIMAWMLLWRATVAAPKLDKILGDTNDKVRIEKLRKNKNAAFYEGQIKSAEYFIQTVLPVTLGKMNAIKKNNRAIVDIPEISFG